MKTKWVQVDRFSNTMLSEIISNQIPLKAEHRWMCNLSKQDIKKLFPDTIVRDIMLAWSEINYHNPTSARQINSEVLWYNSHLKCQKKVIFNEKLYKKGLWKVSQLMDHQGIKSFEKMQSDYGTSINIIDYHAIIQTIPKEWLSAIKHSINVQVDKPGIEIVKNNMKCSSIVYKSLRDRYQPSENKRLWWEDILQREIRSDTWFDMYSATMKLTNSTKLRFFQFRLINGYILTNERVSKWDKNTPALCTFCGKEIETIIHLFITCTHTHKMWVALKKWLDHFCFLQLDIEPFDLIFNMYKNEFKQMVNTLILIMKYYIYVKKIHGHKPNFSELLCQISKYKRIEERKQGKKKNMIINGVCSICCNIIIKISSFNKQLCKRITYLKAPTPV